MRRRVTRSPEGFEAFYKTVRGRLLLQTYALTGDLQAAERAVRDALVVAWHHWRKVSRLDEPEDWVRPLAWTRAQRRSSARWWSRQKDITPEVRATLDALGKLTTTQRKVLLLTHLTALPMDRMSREIGVTRATTERELQTASAQFAVHRDIASTSIRAVIEALAPGIEAVRWPRSSILMRAGSARRRAHTTVGAVAVVAALVVSGSLVTDAAGVRPALQSKGILDTDQPGRHSAKPEPPPDPLTPAALLATDQVTAAFRGSWIQGDTTRNTDGDGLVFTCQAGRYADARGIGALVRTFAPTTPTTPPAGPTTVGQSAEASADEAAGERTYDTTLGWYAGCVSPRVQLLSTHRVRGVGDEAALLVLRDWNAPVTTQVVGVARTGVLTTTVVDTRTPRDPDKELPLGPSAGLLAAAVNGLCTLPDAGSCAQAPRLQDAAPVPVGTHPALLIEADLPPVMGVDQPWVATEPGRARENIAATRCDKADFSGDDFSRALTRSYVIPAATKLSPEFGMAETVGALPRAAAKTFVGDIRDRLAACPDKDLGSNVEELVDETTDGRDLSVWRLTVELSDDRSVRFLMAIMREGTAVAQLTFVPSDDATMEGDAFTELARRAQSRLAQLGAPRTSAG